MYKRDTLTLGTQDLDCIRLTLTQETRVMSSGNAWALICMLYAGIVWEGRKQGQQEKQPFHRGNSMCIKQHQSYGRRMLSFSLEAESEGSKTFASRISLLGTSPHLLPPAWPTPSVNSQQPTEEFPCSIHRRSAFPGSCVVLKQMGRFTLPSLKRFMTRDFKQRKTKSWKGKLEVIIINLHTR